MLELSKVLNESESMYIFPHMRADGDAIGACTALCTLMRKMGKTADILMEDEIPENLMFMTKDYVTIITDSDAEMPKRDLCIALDCAGLERFPVREKIFLNAGRKTASLDHHIQLRDNFADVNLVDSEAAAACELLYEFFAAMGYEIDTEMAESIYSGIVTDTGNFQNANTTKKTHLITAELYDYGIDVNKINITIFRSDRPQKLKLHSMIMNHMEYFCNNMATMAYVTLDMYREAGAYTNESDGINSQLRDIRGVEVAVFLREAKPGEIKAGFRSKEYMDVAVLCNEFGGGGHKHAAGCTIYGKSMQEALDIMREAVTKEMEKYDKRIGEPA